ncbi:PREDICTED: protein DETOXIFICATION 21-like [Ipomoea nil]|uniref:protein DETOXIFICATION 21-like n=1 Tax=Ipomoea nil TaxID=35883 RepID=UPI0009009310|nr:PREDICTED: protein DETOXIFICATION 21-like [Ipomoea nil]
MESNISEKLLENSVEEVKIGEKICCEMKKMSVVVLPAIFNRFSTFGITVISLSFIGHIDPIDLAAYALVQTVLLRFCNGVLLGMASGLETLLGQAFGAKQYHMMGIYLQRAWIVLSVTTTSLLPLYFFTTPIFKALGQEEEIAQVTGIVSKWLIPVAYAFIPSYTCQMFLQAQSKNVIIAYLAAATLAIHLFLSWLLTVKLEFGLAGAMISTILAFWIPNFGQLLFVMCGGCKETWRGFSFLAFKDLLPVIKLSLSAGAMVCLELWYYSILILLTGNLENAKVQIDALSICLNISGWEIMISFGFMAAACVRVANELGKGSAKAAKFSINVVVLTSFSLGVVLFLFFLFLRGNLAYLFTTSYDVVQAVDQMSPLLAFSILLNSVQPVLSGVAVGAGLQSTVAYVNLGCYYLIGIPVGVVLGYVLKLQVKGVWIGMLFGTFLQTIILLVITFKTDWDKQVEDAQKRVRKWVVEPETGDANGQDA